jgi:hypothetical protein
MHSVGGYCAFAWIPWQQFGPEKGRDAELVSTDRVSRCILEDDD